MPIHLDRHDERIRSLEEAARLHLKDLEHQDRDGVQVQTWWYDGERATTSAFVGAPDMETADRAHAETLGHVANRIISVDPSALGRSRTELAAP